MKSQNLFQSGAFRRSSLVLGCASTLFSMAIFAEVVDRPVATVTASDDALPGVVNESIDLSVTANDTLISAGNVSISVASTSDKGGALEVVGSLVRYTPPTSLQIGDTDTFAYTVSEENWSIAGSPKSLTAIAADLSGLGSSFVDAGNGGTYVVTNAPGFSNATWDGVAYSSADINGNIDKSSLYRFGVQADLSSEVIQGCNSGQSADFAVSVAWGLTKTEGSSKGYEASISRGLNFPLADEFGPGNFVREDNWVAGDTRTISFGVEGLTTSEFESLQIGLWAQDAQTEELGDDNNWTSNFVDISYSVDRSACQIASATATVTVTIGPPLDSDGDAVFDNDDLDDDNDGIPDSLEQDAGGVDRDSDNDGVFDRLDLDSDNDGLLDIQESGLANIATLDTDIDGRIDGDTGANGLADSAESAAESGIAAYNLIDTDLDGVFDVLDLDSDNDGVPDFLEAGGAASLDADANARLDGAVGVDGLIDNLQPNVDQSGYDLDGDGAAGFGLDTDGDGVADFRDPDSDADGLSDLIEGGGDDAEPAGGDGVVDDFVDTNGDGLDDAIAAVPLSVVDTDGDGVPNFQDTDSDGDGLPDKDEAFNDTNGDGVPDYLQSSAQIETGVSGGGCALSTNRALDPTLPLMVLLSMLLLVRGRRNS